MRMKRTPIDERVLPAYSRAEEIMNMVSHIVGAAVGAFVLAYGIWISVRHGNAWGVVTVSVYGAALIWLYTMSSVYHGLRPGRAKKVMQVLDHCTIYVLIAGTYMPVLLVGLRPFYPALAWTMFGIECGLLALTTTFTAIDLKKYRVLSMTCYIVMGWLMAIAVPQVTDAIGKTAFMWLLSGGIAYTIGAVLYGIGKKRPWFHCVFHLFVLLGSALQAAGILFYVL